MIDTLDFFLVFFSYEYENHKEGADGVSLIG